MVIILKEVFWNEQMPKCFGDMPFMLINAVSKADCQLSRQKVHQGISVMRPNNGVFVVFKTKYDLKMPILWKHKVSMFSLLRFFDKRFDVIFDDLSMTLYKYIISYRISANSFRRNYVCFSGSWIAETIQRRKLFKGGNYWFLSLLVCIKKFLP